MSNTRSTLNEEIGNNGVTTLAQAKRTFARYRRRIHFRYVTIQEAWLNNYAGTPRRSLTTFDRPRVFKFSAHYELPIGKGRRFAANANRLVNGFIGGWDVNSFYIASCGEPANLPCNAIMLKDPAIPADRKKMIVRGLAVRLAGPAQRIPHLPRQSAPQRADPHARALHGGYLGQQDCADHGAIAHSTRSTASTFSRSATTRIRSTPTTFSAAICRATPGPPRGPCATRRRGPSNWV